MTENYNGNTLYFANPGPKNTGRLMAHAAARFDQLGLKKVVIATCTGRTVEEALTYFDPEKCDVIGVTHVTGYSEVNFQTLPEEKRAILSEKGVKFVTAAHAFGGVGRAIRNKYNAMQIDEFIANTLRMFSQGVKVCAEISLMAADRGFVRTDEDILAVGGTGRGADTAMIVQPANLHNMFDLKLKEIVARPR